MSSIDRAQLFATLESRLRSLDPAYDNEAVRHDLLVYPILTEGLGWHGPEVLGQQVEGVSEDIRSSYFWRDAAPLRRRPDLIVVPYGLHKPIAVVEEKDQQLSLDDLRRQAAQLSEYQCLFNCVWGVLTDGEHWIVRRNLEIVHEFASLQALFRDFAVLYSCIGRDAVLRRLTNHGTADLVVVYPSPHIRIVFSPHCSLQRPIRLLDLISTPSGEVLDVVRNMVDMLDEKEVAWRRAHPRMEMQALVQHLWRNCATPLLAYLELLQTAYLAGIDTQWDVDTARRVVIETAPLWECMYYWTDRFYDQADLGADLIDAFMNLYYCARRAKPSGDSRTYSRPTWGGSLARILPRELLGAIQAHELFSFLPPEEIGALRRAARGDGND